MKPKKKPARFRFPGPTKRRKTAAEKMDAAERERRLSRWLIAMDDLYKVATAVGTAAGNQLDIATSDTPTFTPMRADFAWAARITKQLKQLHAEIARYK